MHRFIEFMPTHRARLAVAANAGWYTMPDDTVAFPYGLEGSPRKEWELGHALASNLVILLGSDDVDDQDDSLRRDSGSDAQGMNRLDRGLSFYKAVPGRSRTPVTALRLAANRTTGSRPFPHRYGTGRSIDPAGWWGLKPDPPCEKLRARQPMGRSVPSWGQHRRLDQARCAGSARSRYRTAPGGV